MANKMDKIESIFAAPLDYLAKRKLNTAPTKQSNITLDDIEHAGLTLESLETLSVPVYKYQTQVTLHGIWPDDTDGYCFGYKHIVKNKNGSIGVRYAAIDARKKRTIRRISLYSQFNPHRDSQGTTFVKGFKDDTEAIKTAYLDLQNHRHLFVGSISILRSVMTGRLYLEVSLQAIPKQNLWSFCELVLGLNKADYRQKHLEQSQKDKARDLERQQEQAKWDNELKALQQRAHESLITYGLKPFSPNGSSFRGIKPSCNIGYYDNTTSIKYTLCEAKRKGPNICIMRKTLPTITEAVNYVFDWSHKARKYQNSIKTLYI